mgnify:CR=1 FL=1
MGVVGNVVTHKGMSAPIPQMVGVLLSAFEAYEPWAWAFGLDYAGSSCSSWRLERSVSGLIYKKHATAYVVPIKCDGDVIGAAAVGFVSVLPDAKPPPPLSLRETVVNLWNLGLPIALRLKQFNEAVDAMHEADAADVGPHAMVSLVGVLPHMQGKGLCSQLMRAILADVDSQRLPCYLFTGNDRNVWRRLDRASHPGGARRQHTRTTTTSLCIHVWPLPPCPTHTRVAVAHLRSSRTTTCMRAGGHVRQVRLRDQVDPSDWLRWRHEWGWRWACTSPCTQHVAAGSESLIYAAWHARVRRAFAFPFRDVVVHVPDAVHAGAM